MLDALANRRRLVPGILSAFLAPRTSGDRSGELARKRLLNDAMG
jgi:hypothetical protein